MGEKEKGGKERPGGGRNQRERRARDCSLYQQFPKGTCPVFLQPHGDPTRQEGPKETGPFTSGSHTGWPCWEAPFPLLRELRGRLFLSFSPVFFNRT